jgi:hypothetical protein
VRLRCEAASRSDEPEADVAANDPPGRTDGAVELLQALSCHAAAKFGMNHHVDQLLNVVYLDVQLLEVER